MLKLALLGILGMGTAFYAGGRAVYSGLQLQIFGGAGLKVTPDPSNIWSWHETIPGGKTVPVLVDFDKNGKMDSENPAFRVLITDMQTTLDGNYSRISSVRLLDDQGTRWDLSLEHYDRYHD